MRVVVVRCKRKVASETHRNGASRNLGKTGRYDQAGLRNGSGEASREGKRHGQTIGHPNNDVANRVAG